MANHPTAAYWNSKSEIISAAVKGFNMLSALPKMLKEAYPWMKELELGFSSTSDLPEWHSQGWIHLRTEHFDIDEFNKSDLPSRFGLTDDGGAIKWRDNWLMIMGKDFRDELVGARNQAHETRFQDAVQQQRRALPGDPRAAEMAEYSSSMFESARLQPQGSSDQKRGPGRPKKN